MYKKDIDSEYSILVKLVCFKKKTHMPLRNQHYPKEDPSFKRVQTFSDKHVKGKLDTVYPVYQ